MPLQLRALGVNLGSTAGNTGNIPHDSLRAIILNIPSHKVRVKCLTLQSSGVNENKPLSVLTGS